MTAPTLTPGSDQDSEPQPRTSAVRGWLASAGGALRGLRGRVRLSGAPQLTRSPWLGGIIAAVWAAAIGLAIAVVPMTVLWIASPGMTWLESVRIAGLLWVVAQGTPVAIGPVTYSLVPWGLAIVPILLLAYAGGWAARRCRIAAWRGVAVISGTAAIAYAAIVGVVASWSGRPDSFTSAGDAVAHALVLALLAVSFGAIRASDVRLADLVPGLVLLAGRAGLAAAVTVLGAGALAAGVALTVKVDDAITMTQSLQAGLWGGLGLLLVGLAFVPTMIVWAASYLLGAGFTIGPAVVVSPFVAVTAPTTLPPFPLLAAIPQTATPAAWALPIVGVAAGVLAGLMVSRRARGETRLTRLAVAVGAAAVCAAVLFVAAVLADGALGDVRLVHLGPSPTTVAVLAFVLAVLGAVPSALVGRAPGAPRLAVAEPQAEASADALAGEGDEPVVPATPDEETVDGE